MMLQECPSRSSSATKVSVVATLHNLHRSGRCHVQGAVLCCSPGPEFRCHLRLDLCIKRDAITGALPWDSHHSAGELFSSIIPATQATMHDATVCPLCALLPEDSGVHACFLCSLDQQQPVLQPCSASHTSGYTYHRRVQTEDEQWHMSASDLRARVLDSLVEPVNSDTNAAPFKLHSCFEELPNWLVIASEYPPLPPVQPGTILCSFTAHCVYTHLGAQGLYTHLPCTFHTHPTS